MSEEIKKHPLAIAWDKWLTSKEGQHCRAPNAALARESPYLENRLHRAFMAGANSVDELLAAEREACAVIAEDADAPDYEYALMESGWDDARIAIAALFAPEALQMNDASKRVMGIPARLVAEYEREITPHNSMLADIRTLLAEVTRLRGGVEVLQESLTSSVESSLAMFKEYGAVNDSLRSQLAEAQTAAKWLAVTLGCESDWESIQARVEQVAAELTTWEATESALVKLQEQDKSKGVRIIVTRYVGGAVAYDCQRFNRFIDGWRSISNASTLTAALEQAASSQAGEEAAKGQ